MSGLGSTVGNGGRKRWLVRLLLLFILIAALVTQRGMSSRDGGGAGGDARGGDAVVAKDPSAAVSGSGNATQRGGKLRAGKVAVVVPGALRLEGLIVDQDDRPVGGVRVTIGEGHEMITEADGGFAFDQLAEGQYDVIAEQGALYAESQDVRLDEESEPVTIQLVRGPTIVVHVVDQAGKPIGGAKVEMVSREYETGADGVVVLRGVDMDDELVYVSAAGKQQVRERVKTGDDPAATIEKTIALRSGAEITGKVLDHESKPVEDAYVELEPAGGGRSETTFSDAQGVWHLPDIGGGNYVARASSKVNVAVSDRPVEHDGVHVTKDVVLRVEPGGEIAGIVVDTAGHPVPEARVSAGSISETTDKDGRFVARGLGPDKYDLSVSTPQLGAIDHTVVLARGQHADVKIVVVPSSLAGFVVDSRGVPVEEASVFARSTAPDAYGYGRTDEYGHFDLGGLPPGRYKITAQREDSHVESKEIEAATGNRQVRLMVFDHATITGRVVLGGAPVPYYGFVVDADGTDTYSRPAPVRDTDGRFTVKDAQLGTFAVIIVGPGFARRVVEGVRVVSGQVTDLGDVAVEKGEVIRGRVVDERGVGVGGATVRQVSRMMSATDSPLRAIMQGDPVAETDPSGNYELAGLPPITGGDRTLEATHPTAGASTLRTIRTGESIVDLVLGRTGSIDGTIVGALGDMSLVTATRADESSARYTTEVDSSGAFHFPQLPPADYEVEVLGRNTLPAAHAKVTGGGSTKVTFEVSATPVELRIHVKGGCSLVSLRSAATDELLTIDACTVDLATFKDVTPGPYKVCPEMGECQTLEVPAVPVHEIEIAP